MSLQKFLEKIRTHYHKIIVVVIFCIAIYHRIRWIIGKPQIDGDEKWQLAIMKGSFFEMLSHLQLHEHCSYLAGDYLVIYPFFKIFGFNKWGLAIPHLTLDLLGIFFLYLLAKRYINGIWGYIITLGIVSFNRPLIMHSAEVRTYAALPFLAVLSLYFAQMLVENGANLKRWQKISIGLFYVATLWFHVYGVVIVFCTVLYSLLARFREKSYGLIFKRMAGFFGAVLLIAMPFWCYCVIGPHLPRRLEDTFLYIPNPFVDLIGFFKGVFCNLIGYKYFYFLLLGAIVPFVLPVKDRSKQIGFFLTLVMLPLSLLLLGVLLQHYWFIQRQFTWVVPFFALYLGWAWQEFFNYAGSRLKVGKA